MIKFSEINEKNKEKLARRLFLGYEYGLEILNGLDLSDEDVSYAAAYVDGCAVIRIFDLGRYMFLYPFELGEDADIGAAIAEVAEYARREEIGLVFADVPTEAVSFILSLGFLHIDADSEGDDSYRVRIKSELELAPENIRVENAAVTLDELKEADTEAYAALCRDAELNRFWGYDYRDDDPNAADDFFLQFAEDGRARGTSLSLAIRTDGALIGEVQLFAFDMRGECEFAIRIAGEYQSRGFGSLAVQACIKLAEMLDLKKLSCDVINENLPSLALMRKYFAESEGRYPDRTHFEFVL